MPREIKSKKTSPTLLVRSPYFNKIRKNDKDKKPLLLQQQQEENQKDQNDIGVPDNIDYDLKVLFVGINPGLVSAARGHHFAGPTNHFWPCLSESGK